MPKITHYRNYKNFLNNNLPKTWKNYGSLILQMLHYQRLMTFLSVLDKHTPREMKDIRSTSRNFMTKEPKKAIMNRSKLRNKNFLKTKNLEYINDVLIAKEMPQF